MISVSSLTRYYGAHPAVADVSFSIADKEVVGLAQRAGKSTTLKVLAALLMPTAGQVRIDGVDVLDAPDSFRQRIGFLPEDPPLYREMQVAEFLRWVGQVKGLSKTELKTRLPEVLALCQLSDRADRVIGTSLTATESAWARSSHHSIGPNSFSRRAQLRTGSRSDRGDEKGPDGTERRAHGAHFLAHSLGGVPDLRSNPGTAQRENRGRRHRGRLSKTLQASESEGTHFDVIVRGDATRILASTASRPSSAAPSKRRKTAFAIEVEARTDVREQAQRLIEAGLDRAA